MNPSSGSDKIFTRFTSVIKAKVIQLTDFPRRKIVVGNAHVVFVALVNTLKPVNRFNSVKHMAREYAVMNGITIRRSKVGDHVGCHGQ